MKKFFLITLTALLLLLFLSPIKSVYANEIPNALTVRSKFYTSFNTSTKERAWNIMLASKSLNKTLVEPNTEFSFNSVVGERSLKRGYKTSKVIFDGEFTEGVGGGVCQVSSTLYNAILTAGLQITEYHPHSLPVSYVAPSFDAMVSFGYADLKFVNNTKFPVVILTDVEDFRLTVIIKGAPKGEKYIRESQIVKTVSPPEAEIIVDTEFNYPELKKGERKFLAYPKDGYKSVGRLIKVDEKGRQTVVFSRKDYYSPQRGKIIEGISEIEPRLSENTLDN